MDKLSRKTPAVQAMLRELGNPYAAEQMFGAQDEQATTQEGLSARELLRRSENPHAHGYYLGEEEDLPVATAAPANTQSSEVARAKLAKDGFRSECRTVFRRYIPALDRGKLRPHHQAFITRNENRPAHLRHALVAQLKRYDLSGIPGLSSKFNRERDDFTEEKLRIIERVAGIDE